MKARASNSVTEIKRNGVSVRIRPTIKDGTTRFVLDYHAKGQRKLVWRSTMADARAAADDAIDKITEGQAEVLNLKSADAHAYTRARAALDGLDGEGFIEVKASNAKTDTRRIVPLKPNLKAFLLPLAKKSGKVISVVNTTKQLLKAAADTGDAAKEIKPLAWKHNALRHSYISARVAECGDVPRVADEAGNSPQVIRSNYLKRIGKWVPAVSPRDNATDGPVH